MPTDEIGHYVLLYSVMFEHISDGRLMSVKSDAPLGVSLAPHRQRNTAMPAKALAV
jgi:hypothetical protein